MIRMVNDPQHWIPRWLTANYNQVLPSFSTALMIGKHEEIVAELGIPTALSDEVKEVHIRGRKELEHKIRSATAHPMVARSHYWFKTLLACKMDCVCGRLTKCDEGYTSKTRISGGGTMDDLDGDSACRCPFCLAVHDRDVSAATNVLHENMQMLN